MSHAKRIQHAGFSLVELMVALVFISILLAGMLRVYGASIQSFAAANETVKAQRDNRWALQSISDDLETAGFFYYFAGRPTGAGINVSNGAQNPLMLLPSQTITNTVVLDPARPVLGGTTSETITFDELQFLRDDVLPMTGNISSAPVDSAHMAVSLTSGDLSQLKQGDFVVLLDAAPYQMVMLDAAPGSGVAGTLTLSTQPTQDPATGTMISAAVLNLNHQPGVDLVFVRPSQVLRYTVLPLALEPSNPAATVPCLIKDEAPYPSGGSLINWPPATANAAALAAANVTRTIIAQNVTGLRFDMSLDQGATWTRGATWGTTQTNLNAQLGALASKYPGLGYATSTTDPTNPLWYRGAPILFRADVSTRTLLQRSEYSATGDVPAYRTRTQTMFIQPRNFGLGI